MILRDICLLLLFFITIPFYGQEKRDSSTFFYRDDRNLLLAKYSFTNALYYYTSEAGEISNFDFKDVLSVGLILDLNRQSNWSYEIGVSYLKAVYASSPSSTGTKPSSNQSPITSKNKAQIQEGDNGVELYSFPAKVNIHFLKYGYFGFGPKLNLTTKKNTFEHINKIGYIVSLGGQLKSKNILLRVTTDFDNHTWHLFPPKKKHHLFLSSDLSLHLGVYL